MRRPIAPADRAPAETGAPAARPAAEETPAGTASSAPLSRRRLLKLVALTATGLAGSKLALDWLNAVARPAAAAPIDPALAGYEASAHRWGMVVDATACIGCGRCVVACKNENGVPFDAEHTRTWVERHTVAADGSVEVDSPEAGIAGFASAPAPKEGDGAAAAAAHFVPRLCMQCENSPCTSVCPVGATYRTPDGVILVDAERCIGCGYCVVACPYGARYLVPAGTRTPAGVAGVADKCTFCYHRITRGREPACAEVCPVGARIFGDFADPASRVSTLVAAGKTRVMKERLGTRPRVHYIGLDEEAAR